MMPCKVLLPVIALLVFFQPVADCALKKSKHDKERDKQMEEQHRDKDRLEIEKRQEEATEKKLKQYEEIRKTYYEEHLKSHPTEFFNARIMGCYGMKDGKPVRFIPIEGKVSDILDEKRVFVNVPAPQTETAGSKSPTLVLVVLEKAETFSKGDKFFVPNLIEAGLYNFSKTDGTPVSIKMYKQIPGITLKEFLQLKKDGYKFPEEISVNKKN